MNSFSEIELSAPLVQAIQALGYQKPSDIQAQALPLLLAGDIDFIGLAATGTGKTAAYGIPLLEKIAADAKGVQALILCPTRELSIQVTEHINALGKFKGIQALTIYGGASYAQQLRGLRQGIPVVVGTPGRLIDHIERGTLKLDSVSHVILDEADEMVSMGFREDIDLILSKISQEKRNFWLFSATMSPAVRQVAMQYLKNPKTVQVNRKVMLSATVDQIYLKTQEKNKAEVLCKVIDTADDFYGIIFCQTKALVDDLSAYLSDRGYKAECLHGDMSQKSREQTLTAFRQKRTSILVCTDVASRGIDVKDITHVINYSLPRELENYVHRIGRTARSGKSGIAISLVTPAHKHLIPRIEKLTSSQLREGNIPTRRQVGQKKVGQLFTKFVAQDPAKAVNILSEDWLNVLKGQTAQEIAGRFIAMMYPEVFSENLSASPMTDSRQQGEWQEERQGERRAERQGERQSERQGERRSDRTRSYQPAYGQQKRESGAGHSPRGHRSEFSRDSKGEDRGRSSDHKDLGGGRSEGQTRPGGKDSIRRRPTGKRPFGKSIREKHVEKLQAKSSR